MREQLPRVFCEYNTVVVLSLCLGSLSGLGLGTAAALWPAVCFTGDLLDDVHSCIGRGNLVQAALAIR